MGGGKINSLNAQETQTVTIGEGDAGPSYYLPSQFWYKYSFTQQIYTSEQLGLGKGVISDIAFYRQDTYADRSRTIDIYMVNTSKSSFSANDDWVMVTEGDKVFSGSVTFKGASWNVIDISDFEYTGGNILICIDDNTGSDYGNTPFNENKTDDYTALYYYNDNLNSTPNAPEVGSNRMQKNNQIKITYTPSAEVSIEVTPTSIAFGERASGAWMEPKTIEIKAQNTNVTSVTSDNPFFVPGEIGASMEIATGTGEVGAQSGTLTIAHDGGEPVTVEMTATAYTPVAPDVYELATKVESFPYTNTPTFANLHDNYVLPNETTDGNLKDAVYELDLDGDVILSASVTGTNAQLAIYDENFNGVGGPSNRNNVTGTATPNTESSSVVYDFNDGSMNGFTVVDNDANNYYSFSIDNENGVDGTSCLKSTSSYYNNTDLYMIIDKSCSVESNTKLFFDTKSSSYGSEYYEILLSSTGNDVADFTTVLHSESLSSSSFVSREIELGEYAGHNVYIAIHHKVNSYTSGYSIYFDNIEISTPKYNVISNMLFPAGKYYLVAAAESEFSVNISTQATPAPVAATYKTPVDGATAQVNPKLTWDFGAYTSEYQVLLGTDAENMTVVKDWTSELATEYQTENLSNSTKYFWQVNVRNSSGTVNGAKYSFVTPLEVPTGLAVTTEYPMAEENIELTWNEIDAAIGYNVYVYSNGYAKLNDELITTNSCTIVLDYGSAWYIYVSAVYDDLGESDRSSYVQTKVSGYNDITGIITNGAGATLTFVGEDEFGRTQTYTTKVENDDTFIIRDVLVGTYTVTASKFDYQDLSEELVVTYTPTTTFNSEMTANPVVAFEVTADESSETTANVSWDNEATKYNVYRKDLATEEIVKLTNEPITDKQYEAIDWSTLKDGKYQYGVSAILEQNEIYINNGFGYNNLGIGWTKTHSSNGNSNYDWVAANSYTYKGETMNGRNSYAAFSKTGQYYGDNGAYKYYLNAPQVDLTDAMNPILNFYYLTPDYFYNSNGTSFYQYTNLLKVQVSTDGSSWTDVWQSGRISNTSWKEANVDLNAYKGQKIYVRFETDTYGGYCTGIDDVVLKSEISAESQINWSNTLVKGGKVFTGNGSWTDAANWTGGTPESTDDVVIKGTAQIDGNVTVNSIIIKSGASLTIASEGVLNVTDFIDNTVAGALVIEDGAQVYQYSENVAATFNMQITTPSVWSTDNNVDGWQFISSPFTDAKTAAFKPADGDFDLYRYDGTKEGEEWYNYKANQPEPSTFFYEFATDMQGWTTIDGDGNGKSWNNMLISGSSDFTYVQVGCDDKDGCLYDVLNGETSICDYLVSPEKVYLASGSNFSFYAKNYSGSYGKIKVLISRNGNTKASDFTEVYEGSITSSWNQFNVSLSAYDGEEVWLAIAAYSTYGTYNFNTLVDNLELTVSSARGGGKPELFEKEFQSGVGYLASYEKQTSATLTGTLNNATSFTKELSYNETKELANFHLLGNPFSFDMDMKKATFTNMVQGVAIVTAQGGYNYEVTEIPVGDGFFVKTTADGAEFSYNHGAKSSRSGNANSLNVIATSNAGNDNVVINFAGEQEGFPKMRNFNDAIATVYVQDKGANYGIYNCDENTTEVELCFNANQMGNYTISIEPNGKFQTVTLVDRFTGIETNMLLEDYSFTAMSEENNNRFILKLAVSDQQSAVSDNFVYQSGEELIVEAEGTVQIIDVMGRVVYNNDVTSDNNRINVSDFNNGAYVVRVINESEIKVEKVVIY